MTAQQIATRLREKADTLTPKIAHRLRDRLTNTRKRAQEDEGMRREGRKLECVQAVMRAVADRHEAGYVPALPGKKVLMSWRYVSDFQGPVGRILSTERHVIEYRRPEFRDNYTDADRELHALILDLGFLSEGTAEKIHRMERDLKLRKIPGFFPSRPSAVNRLMELAALTAEMSVLEP